MYRPLLLCLALAAIAAGCKRDTGTTGHASPDAAQPIVAELYRADRAGAFMLRPASGDEPAHLILHEGEATGDSQVVVDVDVPAAGDYRVWLRARWRDTCGNSVTLHAPGLPPLIVGEDAVYEVWHWVSAGPIPLAAGPQQLTLAEREDGIELDQLVLTLDSSLRPSGRFDTAAPSPTPVVEEVPLLLIPDASAADDFNRSAGHGLGDWEVVSGDWQLNFSFDPNRVPLQYAMTGAAAVDAGDAVCLMATDPWLTCRLEFAVQPVDAQAVGAVLDQGSEQPIRVAFQTDGWLIVNLGGHGNRVKLADRWRLGQWHHVVIDRGADSLTISLDGHVLSTITGIRAQTGAVGLLVAGGSAAFDDVAAGSGSFAVDQIPPYIVGPYDFQSPKLVDPSDYLDFTPEEVAAMAASPDAEKLRRSPRENMQVVGRGGAETAAWLTHHGSWTIADGALTGHGRNSILEHVGGFDTAGELRLRIRLPEPGTVAMLNIYGDDAPLLPPGKERLWNPKGQPIARPETPPLLIPPDGALLLITRGDTDLPEGVRGLQLPAIADADWHDLRLKFTHDTLTATLDQSPPIVVSHSRGDGNALRLGVLQGVADFDNVEIRIPRRTSRDMLHVFDRRDTGWWREGSWIDHSGIACVLASDWVSLIAPEGSGRMRHKSRVSDQVRISLSVEENSEWYGWDAKHSHTHFAFDNVQVGLVDPATDDGYILTVNTEDHQHAILTRNGVEVARLLQPVAALRFRGGHSPFHPRRLHVVLERRGPDIVARLNGHDLLTYTDPSPLLTPQPIVGGHDTRFNIARIEIHDLGQ